MAMVSSFPPLQIVKNVGGMYTRMFVSHFSCPTSVSQLDPHSIKSHSPRRNFWVVLVACLFASALQMAEKMTRNLFPSHFCLRIQVQNLTEVFSGAFSIVDNKMRESFIKLLDTWRTQSVFP